MTMAPATSKTDTPDEPAIDMVDFGSDLLRRRAAYEAKYGLLQIPRNTGTRRTPSKRALLKAIEETSGKW